MGKNFVYFIGSLLAVGLLVLGSLTNVVGYQTVQASQQATIKESINQKDLLFQTICDLANNKDIQRIIFTSEMNRKGFFTPGIKTPIINTPVLTKNQLKQMYVVGVMLSKVISKSKIHSMVEQYHVINQGMQSEISAIIKKDISLNGEVTQLAGQSCNCGIESNFTWHFPIICSILLVPLFICMMMFFIAYGGAPGVNLIIIIIYDLGAILHCRWY